jgi:hypothetical protein
MLQLSQKKLLSKNLRRFRLYHGMPCQNIKTLKINLSTGLWQNGLSGTGQYQYGIKQKNTLKGEIK